MTEGVEGVEARLDAQDERINKQDERQNKTDERLNQHSDKMKQQDDKITKLLNLDEDKHKRLQQVENNYEKLGDKYEKLETTIISENKEMRLFFQSNMDKQWDLIKSRDEQKHDDKKMQHELAKTKVEKWSDIAFKLAGTGSILYLIGQALIKNLGG